MKSRLRNILSHTALLCLLATLSCTKTITETEVIIRHNHIHAHIMMVFGATPREYNNLDSFLTDNIREMEDGFIPDGGDEENMLFLYSQFLGKDSKAATPTLTRIYRNKAGDIVRANVMNFNEGEIANTGKNIKKVLDCIRNNYQADSYGLLISSHGTGWMPSGYCLNPSKFEQTESVKSNLKFGFTTPDKNLSCNLGPYSIPEDWPVTKSIGCTANDGTPPYETDIRELAAAIPYKMEYIIFDACFMGGVEVAYELKDKCRWLCASQAEILGAGMEYSRMLQHLLQSPMELEAVCTDFYNLYAGKSGWEQSATISLLDCSRLDALAAVCRQIFRAHNISFSECDSSKLQRYFRAQAHMWFYDLRSIVAASGANEMEIADLDWALSQCVAYNEATEYFMYKEPPHNSYNGFPITCHSGLSMYLPYPDRTYLNNYYKTLAWNEATGLIK